MSLRRCSTLQTPDASGAFFRLPRAGTINVCMQAEQAAAPVRGGVRDRMMQQHVGAKSGGGSQAWGAGSKRSMGAPLRRVSENAKKQSTDISTFFSSAPPSKAGPGS